MRRKRFFYIQRSSSFLLIELGIALAIFSIFVGAITAVQVSLIKAQALAHGRMQALSHAMNIVEGGNSKKEERDDDQIFDVQQTEQAVIFDLITIARLQSMTEKRIEQPETALTVLTVQKKHINGSATIVIPMISMTRKM